tara:strand:- start:994 stop:1389 length:396 start_codon:yes stop_codon:yes gene_type:complete
MAETKTVLINDGGAPARILNFEAAAAISAGEVLDLNGSAKLALATDGTLPIAGVALVDAAAGDQCSVITGGGYIAHVMCEACTIGDNLMVDTGGTAGSLDTAGDNDTDRVVAMALETQSSSGGTLTKCLVL